MKLTQVSAHIDHRNQNLLKDTRYMYEGVSKSFRTGRLEWELQMVQLSATLYDKQWTCNVNSLLHIST